MLPDFLPTAEVLAKGVRHVACYVADAITERRKAFDDDEAGDYLRCAGADALAEADPMARAHATIAGMASKLSFIVGCDGNCSSCICTTSAAAIPTAADDPAATEDIPPSSVAAGSPLTDCAMFHPDMDEHLTSVAELDWPAVGAALRVIADFFDPK